MGVVLDENRMAPVVAKPGKFFCERQLRIELAQEQKTGVSGDLAAIEIENNFRLKTKRELSKTLCSHRSSVCCARLIWSSTLFLAQFDGVDGFFIRSTMNNPG
jgi:hypothetical protein